MKVKTINRIIGSKFKKWVATIEDSQVRNLVEANSICTGGCIASLLMGTEVNDYDFYFRNTQTAEAVARYYLGRFKRFEGETVPVTVMEEGRVKIGIPRVGIVDEDVGGDDSAAVEREVLKDAQSLADEEKPEFVPVFVSENAISLSGKVQMVVRFTGEPDEIHKNYDFAHATNYWTSWEKKVTLRQEALECILTKELRYIGSKYPICSIMRLRKFIERGYTINAGQILKILLQVNSLDLNKFEVIREQLAGVDVSYFFAILEKLAEKDPEKINKAYLVEILDRMF